MEPTEWMKERQRLSLVWKWLWHDTIAQPYEFVRYRRQAAGKGEVQWAPERDDDNAATNNINGTALSA